MGKKKRMRTLLLYIAFCSVVCAVMQLVFRQVAFLKQVELTTLDVRYRLRPPIRTESGLATIDIDSSLIDQVGVWPVSRRVYAEFIKVLCRYNARLVSLDVLFPDPGPNDISADQVRAARQALNANPSRADDLLSHMLRSADDELAEEIGHSGRVILAQTFRIPGLLPQNTSPELFLRGGGASEPRFSDSIGFDITAFSSRFVPQAVSAEPPFRQLMERAAGIGFAQTVQDEDGAVRNYPLFVHYKGRLYPSLAMMGVLTVVEVPLDRVEIRPGQYVRIPDALVSDEQGRRVSRDITVPVDRSLRMIVNWAGDYLNTFTHFPGNLVLRFGGVDVARRRIHEYADDPGGLIGEGFAATVSELTSRELMTEVEAELAVRNLLLAQLAESMQAANSGGKQLFIEQYAPDGDEETRRLLDHIWMQVLWNREALHRLTSNPGQSDSALKRELNVPEERAASFLHSMKFLRFILNSGTDLDSWRPLYFFPPVQVSLEGCGASIALSPLDLENKQVYIGLTATGTHDFNPMPFASRYPMIGLHVNAANTLLTQQFVRPLPAGLSWLLMLVCALTISFFASRLPPVSGVASGILLSGGYCLITQLLFSRAGLWVPVTAGLSAFTVAYLTIVVSNFMKEQREKKTIRSAFSTYMNPSVVNQILKNPDMLQLGGERRLMTVFFSDLAGFTGASEQCTPEELVALLNEYLECMTRIIFRFEGTLDKYEGDGVMAFWNAPVSQEDHACRCCCAALDSVDCLETFLKPKWRDENRPVLNMRVGINTGEMIIGNMGSKIRMDYTVLGDAVNLGAHLEGVGKIYGTQIIISEQTYHCVADQMVCRKLDCLRIKGRVEPVQVYELICRKEDEAPGLGPALVSFHEGLEHYRSRRWEQGVESFLTALHYNEKDSVCRLYLKRCEEYTGTPPPDSWDGTVVVSG